MNKPTVAELSKAQLWQHMKNNNFMELCKKDKNKATRYLNDLWDSMTPLPQTNNKKLLFSKTFIEWMYIVESEL